MDKSLQEHLSELQELSTHARKSDNYAKHDMMEKIYLLNSYITEIKQKYDLPDMDGRFLSDSILESFKRVYQSGKPHSRKTFLLKEYYRAIDYQYYLLGFLLMENQRVNPGNLMLHQIMERFFDRVKNTSLKYEDVIRTASGATRCNTNMRFAMQALQKTRLIKEKDTLLVELQERKPENNFFNPDNFEEEDVIKKFIAYNPNRHRKSDAKKKKTWALSYFGFWVAASFGFDPDEKRDFPFTKNLRKTMASNYLWDVDPAIWHRVQLLGNKLYFNKIADRIRQHVPFDPLHDSHGVIFTEYYRLLTTYQNSSDRELAKITKQVEDIEHRNNLLEFVQNVLKHFDARKVFKLG